MSFYIKKNLLNIIHLLITRDYYFKRLFGVLQNFDFLTLIFLVQNPESGFPICDCNKNSKHIEKLETNKKLLQNFNNIL